MRAVIQRVSQAKVCVGGAVVGEIAKGFLVLLGVEEGDSEDDTRWLAHKIVGLRLFEDDNARMNLSLSDVGGEVLVVSQFTLLGDCRKGRRPSFCRSAEPQEAKRLYDMFSRLVAEEGIGIAQGIFQAHMEVSLCNDGPVTLWIDTRIDRRSS